jgi:hypothetical protein
MDCSLPWLLSLGPIVAALVCLSLAAFEALEIDRVGMYRHPTANDLSGRGLLDAPALLIAEEELGRRLARWTSIKKHSDLLQARAWFSRGLAALIVAALLAAIGRAAMNDPAPSLTTTSSTAPNTTTPTSTSRSTSTTTTVVLPTTALAGTATSPPP